MRLKFFVLGITLLLSIISLSTHILGENPGSGSLSQLLPLSADKQSYYVDDTVELSVNIDSSEYNSFYLLISDNQNQYSYKGDFNPIMYFYPTEQGIYTIALVEKSTGAIYYSLAVNVSYNPKNIIAAPAGNASADVNKTQPSDLESQQNNSIAVEQVSSQKGISPIKTGVSVSTDKKEYALGEQVVVLINFSDASAIVGINLFHSFGGVEKKYVGDLGEIIFIPTDVGHHLLILKDDNGTIIEEYSFDVIDQQKIPDIVPETINMQTTNMQLQNKESKRKRTDWLETCNGDACTSTYYSGKTLYNENNSWNFVNTTFEKTTGTADWKAEKNIFKTYTKKNKIKITGENNSEISFEVPSTKDPAVNDNVMTYDLSRQFSQDGKNYFVNATLTLTLYDDRVEKLITINNLSLPSDFEYEENLSEQLIKNKFSIGDLLIWDSSCIDDSCVKNYYPTSWEYQGNTIKLKINKTWLDQAVYPIIIDPTVYYNFTDSTNNKAYKYGGATNLAGANPTWAEGWRAATEATPAEYLNLSIDGGGNASVLATGTNDDPFWRFEFTVHEDIYLINWVYIRFKGYENAGEAAYCYIANFTNTTWSITKTIVNATPDITWNTTSATQVINASNGKVAIFCYGDQFDNSANDQVFVDFVEVRVNYTTDLTAPTVYSMSPATNNLTRNPTPNFIFNYTDSLSPNASCTLYVGTTMYGTNTSTLNNTQTNITANTTVPDGNYNWSINCTDRSGNNAESTNRTITIDTTSPTINSMSPAINNFTNHNTPDFTFNYTDSLSTTANCTLYVGTTRYGINSTTINNTATMITANASIPDGNYNWSINCTDLAGNSADSINRTITIDTNTPTVYSMSPATNNLTNDQTPDFTFNYTDILSPNSSCTLFVGSTMYGTNSSTLNNTQTTITANASIAQGAYNWSINCTDLAGNNAKSNNRTITIDITSPTVNSMSPTTGNITNNNKPNFFFNYTDSVSPNASCVLYVGAINYGSNTTVLNYTQTNITAGSAIPDGIYNWSINCTDIAGNSADSINRTITIDTTAPTVNAMSPNTGNQTNDNTPDFIFNYTDSISTTANCTLFVGATRYGTNTSTINNTQTTITANASIAQGAYNWSINCTDNAGNNAKSTNRTITIDTTTPTINAMSPSNNNFTNNTQPNFIFNFTDSLSATANCILFVDNTNRGFNDSTLNNTATNITSLTALGQGNHSWYVNCTDNAANTGNSSTRNITIDTIYPVINLSWPANHQILNTSMVQFNYTPVDNNLDACILYGNFSGSFIANETDPAPTNGSANSFGPLNLSEGNYSWNVWCNDSAGNSNFSQYNYSVFVDNNNPAISNWEINKTAITINQAVCINVSVIDSGSGVKNVTAEIEDPNHIAANFTMVDDGSGCDGSAGDGTYSYSYVSTVAGNYSWRYAYAQDYANRTQSNHTGINWTVTQPGSMTVAMLYPAANLEINESEHNYKYQQNCSVSCDAGGGDCHDIILSAQYNSSVFVDITTATTDLTNDENNFNCADLFAGGTPCNHSFNITSGANSGNHTWPIRCFASSSNIDSNWSSKVNITVNDHPSVNLSYPQYNAWLGFNETLNASFSYDSDGSIANYLFEYDNNSAFTSPSTICNGAESICNWNISSQSQCENNSLSCYLRLTVTDNNGLANQTIISIGFDRLGPAVLLDRPSNYSTITGTTYTINASANDAGINNISTVVFEYRQNSLDTWHSACSDNTGTGSSYECSWSIAGLTDGNEYELRARSNDSFGNIGDYDVHYNITIDNTKPSIILVSPHDDYADADGNLVLAYQVNDLSNITNCSLIINNALNQTNTSIQKGVDQYFYLDGVADGTQLDWSINCTDYVNLTNASETRNITVALSTQLKVNVTVDKTLYSIGENVVITTNITDMSGDGIQGNVTTDIVLVFNKSQDVAPWWNTSWKMRKPLYTSNTYAADQTNLTVVVNVSGLAGNITSCANEIRVVSIYKQETPFNIISGDDSNYCKISFKADIAAGSNNENKYFVYYNSSAATSPGYATFDKYYYGTYQPTNVGDSYVSSAATGTNYGTATNVNIRDNTGTRQRTYIKFDMSSIPSYVEGINQSTLCLYLYSNGATANASIYHVYNNSWAETGITYNNEPCGRVNFDNASNCNLTTEQLKVTGAVGWICWNATKMTNAEYITGDRNISMVLKSQEIGSSAVDSYYSRNYSANPALRPYLNITGYSIEAQNITASSTGSPQKWFYRNSSQTNSSGLWTWNWDSSSAVNGNYSAVSMANKTGFGLNYNFTLFELFTDSAAPVINLMSPQNENYTAQSDVIFYYNISDESPVDNCTLSIDGTEVNYTVNPEKGVVLNFTFTFSEGKHNWSINCTDVVGNENISAIRNITIDQTGPVSILYNPPDSATINTMITGLTYKVNATVTDSGIGSIAAVTFLYRYNSSDIWHSACSDNDGTAPFECNWGLTGFLNGNDYEVLVYASDTLGNIGANATHTGITVLTEKTDITSVLVDDEVSIPTDQVDLIAATSKTVYCNMTVVAPNVYTQILGVNATLFSSTSTLGSLDDNRTHYSNSSCSFITGGGDTAYYQCAFNVWHYAINGTWNCTAFAWDADTSGNKSRNTTFNQLFALNISTNLIDYSSLQPNQTSQNVTVNISNVGNMPMNISVYGFGGENELTGTGLSMVCEINNISVSFEKYAINNATDYNSKNALTGSPQNIGFTIPPKSTNDDIKVNSTYWQFMVPPNSHTVGQCNGSVVFMASSP